MKYLPYIIIIFFFLASCDKKEDPYVEPEPEQNQDTDTVAIDSSYVGFNMYFLKDENLTGSDVSYTNLNDLELLKPPFVSQGNIQMYDTSSHVIYLNESISIPDMVSVFGKPFVVATDTIRHYLGVLWPMYSSGSYCGPIIDVGPRFLYPYDIIKISTGRIPMTHDFRLNDTIIQTLKDYNVFHAGISFKIDSVAILENDSVKNDCTISFTIKVVNNDELNFYVFDPVKMGDVFYWYQNNLYFKRNDNYYESNIGGVKPEGDVDKLSWFTKIESKDSVSWTLEKKGYPYIPPGDYQCSFTYWGLNSSSKSFREQPDGRIWMGKIKANYSITVE